MLFTDKSELRCTIRRRIAALTAEQRAHKSALIAAALLARNELRTAHCIALFAALADEPQTQSLIEQLALTHRVVLPRVTGEEMEFADYRADAMCKGAFGIAEPAGCAVVSPAEIDVMVVPGVAFTAEGARLGRGRGYYDRYLSRKGFRATTIGVCFAEQLVATLPTEPHDKRVSAVVRG